MQVLAEVGAELAPLYFFFNDTATTEIYTLSLHDALPICPSGTVDFTKVTISWRTSSDAARSCQPGVEVAPGESTLTRIRSEEHTSELQSHLNLVCRLLLEKKKRHPSELLESSIAAKETPY